MKQRLVTEENKKWWTLAAVSVGLFMIMLDNTIVNVALPSIRRDLGMSLESLEWIVAGYALTFAVPLACVAYYPVLLILGKADPLGAPAWVGVVSPLAGFVFLALAFGAWRVGLRRYASTGS